MSQNMARVSGYLGAEEGGGGGRGRARVQTRSPGGREYFGHSQIALPVSEGQHHGSSACADRPLAPLVD